MIDLVTVEEGHTLTDYGGYPGLATAVRELDGAAALAVRRLNGHTVCMVNRPLTAAGWQR